MQVRDGEDAVASTRDARAPQNVAFKMLLPVPVLLRLDLQSA
jgi:hypothetical protein